MVWTKILQGAVFILLIAFTFTAFPSYKAYYKSQFLPSTQSITSATAPKDELYEMISNYAKDKEVKSIDAEVDKVWKAIPGYNGLKINIDASYRKLKKNGKFNPEKLIFKETSPEIHLKDIQPAPVFRGNPEKPMVSVVFDVASGEEYIPQILNILNKANVSATFYLDGDWVKHHSDIAMMISEEGHEIGNYAYGQNDLTKLDSNEIKAQLKKNNDIIEATLDVLPKWFTPPMGSYNEKVLQTAHSLNLITTLWTIDTTGENAQPLSIVRRVSEKVESGSIIKMNATETSAKALDTMIQSIKKKGYQIGTMTELTDERRLSLK